MYICSKTVKKGSAPIHWMYMSKLILSPWICGNAQKKTNTNERKPTAGHGAYAVNYIKIGYLHKKLRSEKPSQKKTS